MPGDDPKRVEDNLAEAIAESWFVLEKKAAANGDAETKKSEQTLLEWAVKLADILKGTA